MLKVWNVSEERSEISADVSLLNSLISRDNSLEVYDDKSVISEEVSDWTDEISREVSLLRSLISVLKVWNVSEERSSNSLPFSSRSVLISLLSSLEVYDDKSVISEEVNDWTTEISREVSLLRSEISVLRLWKVSEERSEISADVSLLNSLISRDNSLDV